MMQKQIKDSFEKAKLSEEDKKRIYNQILFEAKDSTEENLERKKIMNRKIIMENKNYGKKRIIKKVAIGAACLAAVTIVPVGTYAAYKWLTPSQVASELSDTKLAETFGKTEQEIVTKESEEYRVAFLGAVSGKQIGSSIEAVGEIKDDRSYLVVAIERKDGTEMKVEDDFFISPFVKQFKPWQLNIYTENGASTTVVKDGILYRMIECDNFEIYAGEQVYLAVQGGKSYDEDAYSYDEKSGAITRNESYKGTNVLFDVTLDSSKADPEAVNKRRTEIEKENRDPQAGVEEQAISTEGEDGIAMNSVKDEKNNLVLSLWRDNQFSSIGADDESLKTYFGLYAQVEGKDIKSITYSMDNGVFYKKTEADGEKENSFDTNKYVGAISKERITGLRDEEGNDKALGDPEKNLWLLSKQGNSYTVSYDKQNSVDNVYAIGVTADLTTDARNWEDGSTQLYQLAADALENEVINVVITYKDGHEVTKEIGFKRNDSEQKSQMITPYWK